MPGSSLLPLGVLRLVALDEDTSWSSSLLEKQQKKAGCEKGEARALPGGRNNAKNGNCRVYAPQLTCLSWRQLRVVRESVLEKGVRWRSIRLSLSARAPRWACVPRFSSPALGWFLAKSPAEILFFRLDGRVWLTRFCAQICFYLKEKHI